MSERPAVIDGAGEHTFRRVCLRAHRIASVLLRGQGGEGGASKRGSLDGERVAILVSPSAAWVEAFFGVLLAGGCVVVLSPLHPPPETEYFLQDAGVRTILVSHDLEERAGSWSKGRAVLRVSDLCAEAVEPFSALALAEDPALLLYTSGTTGKPKGAIITHDNLATQQSLLGAAWGWSERDVLSHALPLHHLHGLGISLMTALGAGAAVRMHSSFDAAAVWDSLAAATVFMGVPTMYTRLVAAFDAADGETRGRWAKGAAALRLSTSGSAALPVTLGERWRQITGKYPLERFGMTEVGVGLTNPLDGERRPGTVGLPLPTVEARIVGEAGDDIPSGELWLRGPSIFAGYHGREDATKQAFATPPGEPAWFRTGDTVTRDERGYFKILGRTSVDILKSGGYKLSALEIEDVLLEHPAVAEAAVVGVPDEEWGDRVVACVVARSGQEEMCTEEVLRAFCKERVAPYKVPKRVIRLTELPRNAMGKVVKPELARQIAGK